MEIANSRLLFALLPVMRDTLHTVPHLSLVNNAHVLFLLLAKGLMLLSQNGAVGLERTAKDLH